MSQVPVITIDGPSGVGKGTLAQKLAELTGFHLLDSGAIYRALAYGVSKQGLAIDDQQAIIQLAEQLPVKFEQGKVWYEGEDISQAIRNETIAGIASQVAAIPEVRQALLNRQRAFAQPPGLVADGRDMGTVVFPDAPVKLFLTASAEVRAKRRLEQLAQQGEQGDFEAIVAEIKVRDERDQNRETAPLKPADDAVVIDTSHLTIEEVVNRAVEIIQQKIPQALLTD
ncbi:(d)CMP kinase [Galenea microaerophila]